MERARAWLYGIRSGRGVVASGDRVSRSSEPSVRRHVARSQILSPMPSFVRGIFAGALHDALLFPFPDPLDAHDPGRSEDRPAAASTPCAQMQRDGLIDSAALRRRGDDPRADDHARSRDTGCSASRFRRSTAAPGCRRPATRACSAKSRASTRRSPCSSACTAGSAPRRSCSSAPTSRSSAICPMLARGETLAAYALTEPDIGSDAQNIKTHGAAAATTDRTGSSTARSSGSATAIAPA